MMFEAWLALVAIWGAAILPLAPFLPQLLILAPSALAVLALVCATYCALGLGAGHMLAGVQRQWFDRGVGGLYLIFAAGLAHADIRRS